MSKEKLPIQKEKQFEAWLPKNKVKSLKSIKSYFTYLRNAQSALNVDSIDDFFNNAIQEAIENSIIEGTIKSGKEKDARDARSAVKKYWQFYQSKMGLVPESKPKKKK